MNTRYAAIKRKTNETDIVLDFCVDGSGISTISTGIGFFDHMMTLFSKHSGADLTLNAVGDLDVDTHHTIEDCGITLGTALRQALGDKRGIYRYGYFILPMDEAVSTVALDFSGRYSFRLDCQFPNETIGQMPTELIYDFWDAVAQNAGMNLSIKVEYGRNSHHMAESIWKAVARSCRMAWTIDGKNTTAIPSTKGIL